MQTKKYPPIVIFAILLAGMVLGLAYSRSKQHRDNRAASSPAAASSRATGEPASPEPREKVAEGEYCLGEKDDCDARETWTLWREPEGNYVAEGELRQKVEGQSPEEFTYRLLLDPQMFVLKYELVYGPPGTSSPGMVCQPAKTSLQCHGTDIHGQAISGTVEIPEVYELMEAALSWSYSAMARRASSDGKPTSVAGVLWQSMPGQPAFPQHDMHVRYLGTDSISLPVGQNIPAKKFEIQWPSGAKAPVWIAHKGMLLAMDAQDSHQQYRLTRYTEYSSFAPEVH
jgi:hypothetical protein